METIWDGLTTSEVYDEEPMWSEAFVKKVLKAHGCDYLNFVEWGLGSCHPPIPRYNGRAVLEYMGY